MIDCTVMGGFYLAAGKALFGLSVVACFASLFFLGFIIVNWKDFFKK